MTGGVTGRGFGTRANLPMATLQRRATKARRAKRHLPKDAQASVRAKILARMVALGRASRA